MLSLITIPSDITTSTLANVSSLLSDLQNVIFLILGVIIVGFLIEVIAGAFRPK